MEEEQAFQVRDRRSHLQGASDQPDKQAGARGAQTFEKASEDKSSEAKGQQGSFPRRDNPSSEEFQSVPPVNFSSFILSLATSSLIHLGAEADPATGKRSVQLPMARQVIDLISLLEEKTKGNLTREEETLISQLLFTLRMKYVETEKKHHP